MAKVSILMNGFNAQAYLKEAIDSIYAQTYKDWEIIFIDNCSTDNTKAIVDSYDNKIKYYKTKKNIPIGAARKFGLMYCKGDYIAFLDTDDIWIKDKLEKQIKILENALEFQFCYTGVIFIDENSDEIKRELPQAKSGDIFRQQLIRYEINQQSIVVRNTVELNVNESLKHSPDFNMFMHLASKYQGCVINEYLVKYRVHSNSLTSKNISIWWSEMKYTLDNIFNNKDIEKKYKHEYKYAYAKVAYNKARYLISIGQKSQASKELYKYKFLNYQYFILYIASLMPVSIWNFIHKYK